MSKLITLAAAALIATPATAYAGPGGGNRSDTNRNLGQALHRMIDVNGANQRNNRLGITTLSIHSRGDNPPGQQTRPFDPDRGDDNASDRAILTVCTKGTPAAQRSAICRRGPISPD